MPEGPEIRLTVDYLNSKIENHAIIDWKFIGGRYENNEPHEFTEFCSALPLLVEQVSCKGKLIYFIVHNEFCKFYILHSLRTTGRWQKYRDEFCRWKVTLDTKETLWFRDPRCLATLQFTTEERVYKGMLSKIGPDILSSNFTLNVWNELIKKYKNKNITSFLMAQNIISGCGSYIKCEALYYANISPLRKIKSLTESETEQLFEALRIISRSSYVYKGLSLKDYANESGKKGYYDTQLKIYGKSHATRTKTADGRVTYWDPSCQK